MQTHYPLNPTTGVEDPTQLPWTNGVPSTGQEGSYPPFALMTDAQTELINLLDWAGLTPSDGDMNQVTRAVRGGQLDFDATDTGSADAVLCQIGLPHTRIAAGLPFTFIKGPNANTGNAVPTLTITDMQGNNGLTGTIVKSGGGALAKGDLPGAALITVRARAPGVFAVVSLLTISDVLAIIAANQIGLPNPLPPVSAPGTYTYTPSSPKVRGVYIDVQAPGGGGSASSNTTSSQISVGVPGGGGGYCRHFVPIANAATFSATYVVGAPGNGGTGANGIGYGGGNGGTSSWAGTVIAQGGLGGPATSPVATSSQSNTAAVSGGAASGGNIANRPGGASQASQYSGSTAYGGQGGSSGNGSSGVGYATTSPGQVGAGSGSGGTPGVTQPNASGQAGGAGAPGFIQITEVF